MTGKLIFSWWLPDKRTSTGTVWWSTRASRMPFRSLVSTGTYRGSVPMPNRLQTPLSIKHGIRMIVPYDSCIGMGVSLGRWASCFVQQYLPHYCQVPSFWWMDITGTNEMNGPTTAGAQLAWTLLDLSLGDTRRRSTCMASGSGALDNFGLLDNLGKTRKKIVPVQRSFHPATEISGQQSWWLNWLPHLSLKTPSAAQARCYSGKQ